MCRGILQIKIIVGGYTEMEFTRVEKFKALNSRDVTNVKDCEGEILRPVAYITHEYEDADGKTHNVLVIKDGKSGAMYRTEVKAFIQKFLAYDDAFGSMADDEKPEILIQLQQSKKGNKYVTFDVVDN